MDTKFNQNIQSLQLVDLAEEVNGNLTLSIGTAQVDVTLDHLRFMKSQSMPTDFVTLFTMALVSGGYDQEQCMQFYASQQEQGYGFRLAVNQIDEDTPLNIVSKEANPLLDLLVQNSGYSQINTASGKEYICA